MKALIGRTLASQGRVSISDTPLGRGGEGSVFEVIDHSLAGVPQAAKLVAKIYHEPREGNRGKKVAAMLKSPPSTDSVAWPLALLFTEDKSFAGYIMIKLGTENFRQWAELSNAKDRRSVATSFDVRYALTASRNLAAAIDSVHAAGHRLGDINESNIFISADATVLIVDSDSAQVKDTNQDIYPCLVGKPEYTAAELSHGPLATQQRTVASDVFAYAVAVYQMLTGGAHPTDGIYTGDDDPPSTIEKIRSETFPNLNPQNARGLQKLPRVPADAIPEGLRDTIESALSSQPSARPSLEYFVQMFDEILDHLTQCDIVEQHWFDSRESYCGWCAHAGQGRPDPWSPAVRSQLPTSPSNIKQTSLPSVSFGATPVPSAVKRAPAAVAGPPTASGQGPYSPSNSQNSVQQQYPQQQYSPQGAQAQHSPSQSQPAQEPEKPNKYKGKTLLDFADGTRRVRPAIADLLRSNPKVAVYCIKNETPGFAHAWWDVKRPVAGLVGAIAGLVIALAISVAWIPLLPMLEPHLPEGGWVGTALEWLSYGAVVTAATASIWLFCSATWDLLKTKKRYGSLDNLKRDPHWKTALRFLPIPLVYGPVLLLVILMMLISWIFDALTSGLKR